LAGSGSFLLPALVMGAVGGVMALAAVASHALAEMVGSYEGGDLVKAREIQIRLLPVNTAVTKQFGIAGLKGAMDLMGMYGGPVRLPLLPLEGGQKKEIEEILQKAGLL